MSAGLDTMSAYRACETITRRQARNFSYGIRLLPTEQRGALSAVYALARRVDDVGDADDPVEVKTARLAGVRASVAGLRAGDPPPPDDPVLVAVADAARRFPLPLGAFDELVDGVEADASSDARAAATGAPDAPYRTIDEQLWYCRCVAGSVGRLCLGVFGTRAGAPGATAEHRADTLGLALQQVNILRDVREDLRHGRIYLPTDELAAYGVELAVGPDGALQDPDGGLAALIRAAARRARGLYDEGLELVGMLDRRSAACTTAMAGIYRRLLADIAADPALVRRGRHALGGRQKAMVALRALAGDRGPGADRRLEAQGRTR